MTYIEKLARFREKLAVYGLDAMLILHTDSHQGEYLAGHWMLMPWLTGFTGSAGTVVITRDQAGVWTDSRYFIQGEAELRGSGFELMKLQIPHTPEYIEWLMDNCPEGGKIGVDASLLSASRKEGFEEKLARKKLKLVPAGHVINEIWKNRPSLPQEAVVEHAVAFAGKSRQEKIEVIRQKMDRDGIDYYLIIALDEIAWTFNLRGKDVSYNPVFYSYGIILKEGALLFIDKNKIDQPLKRSLEEDGIQLRDYGEIETFLSQLPEQTSLGLDARKLSWKLNDSIPEHARLRSGIKYAEYLKGEKNSVESGHVRDVMVRDGLALLGFFRWLEARAANGGVSEYEAGLKLEEFRGMQPNYVGPSFNPIVGYKGNGAIVHYRADENSSSIILDNGMLLVDSGGQYLDGTTDITRTISLGNTTEEEKRDFTLVLKGHIQLAMAIFPEGTKGYQLESFARMPIWKAQMNYGHGTGHGVGFYLNVHEGPQSLGTSASGGSAVPLKPGMLTSNEPGLYHKDRYGIRTENLVLVQEEGTTDSYGKFLSFETITLFPIDLNLVVKEMLKQEELDWLNNYHKLVYEKLSPHVEGDDKTWLENACRKI
ncbi:MAG: aminopeptidase P family protein [Bacteroidia bacterium]|nr:aminopeptidase P family protein [Bacteroidia bacterium]